MNYLNKYNSFKVNEANSNNESRERSGRLLTQAQVEYKDDVNKEVPQTLPTMVFTDVVGSSKINGLPKAGPFAKSIETPRTGVPGITNLVF
jgi:hypothetical protein